MASDPKGPTFAAQCADIVDPDDWTRDEYGDWRAEVYDGAHDGAHEVWTVDDWGLVKLEAGTMLVELEGDEDEVGLRMRCMRAAVDAANIADNEQRRAHQVAEVADV